MKISRSVHRSILALALTVFGFAASHASAQTMITSVPYTITASGDYKLATNLNHNSTGVPAIAISAPNVVLDLGGRFVAGPGNPAVSSAQDSVILVGNVANVTVQNGTVAGAAYGIRFTASDSTSTSRNYVVQNVRVTRCYLEGIYFSAAAAPGSLIEHCSFSTIGNSTAAASTSPVAIFSNGSVRMENNNIGDVTATGNGNSYGIIGSSNDFAIGNTIANCSFGIANVSKYLNNLTFNVITPFFGGTGATGNN